VNVRDPIAIKEQLLLAAAFHRGRTGLQQLLDGTVPTSAGEIEELAIAIRGALTLRANQFALQTMQTALGPDDLVRFVEFMRLPPMQSSQAQRTKLDAFRQGMMQILWEKETEANAAKRDQCLKVVAEQIASPAATFSSS
jgi:hypothetical protein